MKHHNLSVTTILTAGLLLSGCQSTAPAPKATVKTPPPQPKIVKPVEPIKTPQKADYSDLYLQGTFNWWSADESYKVLKVGEQLYRAKTRLVADGKYYDFKFADEDFSDGKNCGYSIQSQSILAAQGPAAIANCNSSGSYFRFNPKKTGNYYFYFDYTGIQPKVYIKKAP